jgi:hypothetical protein
MATDDDNIIGFPQSRVTPGPAGPMLDLGLTPLSKSAPMQARAPLGHWCSFCRGVWYSYFLEAQCPRCGNRHG